MSKRKLDMNRYKALARQLAAEGVVMLKNDNNTLPLQPQTKISLFGRAAFNYYKSGTGSGGLVNTRYAVSILDALKACESVSLNEEVLAVYEEWLKDHPFDTGSGWASEPWHQEEMPVTDELVQKAAADTDTAIVIIGRSAGEDKDNSAVAGSYLLTDTEELLLNTVCRHFDKVAVLLNTGNTIDMKWSEACNPSAILYVWQGGQEGGNAVADILTGAVNPSGRLTDTIAYDIEDYPSTANYGDAKTNLYTEDIYMGYRYFETFAKDKVMYPFGYGLSYTTFDIIPDFYEEKDTALTFGVTVTNTGNTAGKEVVQLYVRKPQGKLGKPDLELIGFEKTSLLAPGETARLELCIAKADLSSYDDSGITGHKSCYVLESGCYDFFAAHDIRSLIPSGSMTVSELIVAQQCSEALAPVQPFQRIRPESSDNGYICKYEDTPLRTADLAKRILEKRPAGSAYTGDKGYRLADVYDQKVSMDEFLAQLTDEDLMCIVRGEGMCSVKVTPGTAGAFGGVTDSLKEWGIPIGCCADGPSGIRMDCGTYAFSMPCGLAIGCSMNKELAESLYEMTGIELRKNRIDTLLGPGMNLHRNPLNGRNFEYFSEDPVITGELAAAQLKGMVKSSVTGTIKHFAANNQEAHRSTSDSVASERALRELYLKGFEIAVKKGGAYSIMTTYGALNGLWTAGSYDLNTTILRNEWGYEGIVMTDWWAKANDEGEEPSLKNVAAMVRAQNDLLMVTQDSFSNSGQDNLAEALANGTLTRGELQRTAANICSFLMRSPVMDRFLGRLEEEFETDEADADEFDMFQITYYPVTDGTVIDTSGFDTGKGSAAVFGIQIDRAGIYDMTFRMRATGDELAQNPVSVYANNALAFTISINGTDGEWIERTESLPTLFGESHFIKLFFGQSGMEIESVKFTFKEDHPSFNRED